MVSLPNGRVFTMVMLWALVGTQGTLTAQTTEYTPVREFRPIRMTYDDLSRLLTKVHNFVRNANAGTELIYVQEQVTLETGTAMVRLVGPFSPSVFESAPPVAYAVSYEYSDVGAPIAAVRIELRDYQRRITITGRSQDQVDALAAMLNSDLKRHERLLGGPGFRSGAGAVLFLLGVLVTFAPRREAASRLMMALPVVGPLIMVSVWLFPWDHWIPGTAIYASDDSVLVRQAPLISILGVLLTIFGIWYSRHLALHHGRHASHKPDRAIST